MKTAAKIATGVAVTAVAGTTTYLLLKGKAKPVRIDDVLTNERYLVGGGEEWVSLKGAEVSLSAVQQHGGMAIYALIWNDLDEPITVAIDVSLIGPGSFRPESPDSLTIPANDGVWAWALLRADELLPGKWYFNMAVAYQDYSDSVSIPFEVQ